MHWISSKMSGSRLRYMVVHEVAHQWFYSAVGSNQATEPFADEAVSDFFTRDQLGMFRQPTCATSRLDRSVYDYSAACYNEVVYVQGGLYLRAYRAEVGATKFWAGLRNYVREYDGRLGGTRKLLDALDAASGYDSSRHAARFPSLYP
jgi:aminopeptidase N